MAFRLLSYLTNPVLKTQFLCKSKAIFEGRNVRQ